MDDPRAIYNFPPVVKGDTFTSKTFTITRNAAALDLTGATIKMDWTLGNVLKQSFSIGSGITVSTPSSGAFVVDSFDVLLGAGLYSYDLQITLASGEIVTWLRGNIPIVQDITQ